MPKKNLSYKNRGMFLENIINETNNYYLEKDRAIIYKKPTPIKVLNVAKSINSEKCRSIQSGFD